MDQVDSFWVNKLVGLNGLGTVNGRRLVDTCANKQTGSSGKTDVNMADAGKQA